MAAFAIKGKLDGQKELIGCLQRLRKSARNKILRPAVRAGANVINKAARAAIKPVQTGSNIADRSKIMSRLGLLREAIGVIVRTYANGAIVAMIGPRRGFKKQIGVTTRKRKGTPVGTPIFEDPANIAHLVEFGHGGPHAAEAHAFMRPAFDVSKSAAESVMADRTAKGIIQLAKSGAGL